MNEKKFNRIFSACILIGMTVATIAATVVKFGAAEPQARTLLLISALGSLMGVAATVLSANGLIITFLFGLLDVSIYGAVCLVNWLGGGSGLGNAVLHFAYFVPMQFVGFFQWRRRGKDDGGSVKARRLTSTRRWLSAAIFVAGTIAAYFIVGHFDRSGAEGLLKTAVLLDVLPLVCNILGQWLMSTAYMEQWIFWIGVNIFSIAMWGNTIAKNPDSSYAIIYIIKYAFYLVNSINGLRIWIGLSRTGKLSGPSLNSRSITDSESVNP